jgi:hypothetical protein
MVNYALSMVGRKLAIKVRVNAKKNTENKPNQKNYKL